MTAKKLNMKITDSDGSNESRGCLIDWIKDAAWCASSQDYKIQELIQMCPESLEQRDRTHSLHPFQLVACTKEVVKKQRAVPFRILERLKASESFTAMSAATTPEVIVVGAGLDAINGLNNQIGYYEGAAVHVKTGILRGEEEEITLFRCPIANGTMAWYLSIVPDGVLPGTNADIDFYSAPSNEQHHEVPPSLNWTRAHEGLDPVPKVIIRQQDLLTTIYLTLRAAPQQVATAIQH